jgi:2-iminobutanoate/2-iminopropanoate deaminase
MNREHIAPAGTPAVAPYTPAIAVNGLVFVAGQISVDAAGEMVADDFASQARRTFSNMASVLAAAGCTMADVVSCTTYLTDADDFDAFNAVYQEFFSAPFPTRATILARLLGPGLRIESTCIAARRQ